MRSVDGQDVPVHDASQSYVKISEYQDSWYVQCAADGSSRERATMDWTSTWAGSWQTRAGDVELEVNGYRVVFHEAGTLSRERQDRDPQHEVRFIVLRLAGRRDPGGVGRGRVGLVKFTNGHTRAHIAELLPGGQVAERTPWDEEVLDGSWAFDDGVLRVTVGDYRWVGELADKNGFYLGHESGPEGGFVLPAALVELPPLDPSFIVVEPSGPGEPLFVHGPWRFYPMTTSTGAFARTLLAERPGEWAGTRQQWAAKTYRPGRDGVAEREVGLLQKVDGSDGIISIGEHFRLPDEPRFGEYAGVAVQLVKLYATDLAQYVKSHPPMRGPDVVELGRRLGSAAVELHDRHHILHNDIRPANIVGIPASNDWKLTDFNVACEFVPAKRGAQQPPTAAICLSPALVRQISAAGHDALDAGWRPTASPRDDMWSIGLTLLQAATGRLLSPDRPVHAEDALARAARCSPNVSAMILGCLEPAEDRRWTGAHLRAEATRIRSFVTDYDAVTQSN